MCNRGMWARGVYDSYCLKGLHEDQVSRYDAMAHDDASMYLISVCRLSGTCNYDPLFTLLQDQQHLNLLVALRVLPLCCLE